MGRGETTAAISDSAVDSGNSGSAFTARVARLAARLSARVASDAEAASGEPPSAEEHTAVVVSTSLPSEALSARRALLKLPPGAEDVRSAGTEPPGEGPPPAVGFESFPPPEYGFIWDEASQGFGALCVPRAQFGASNAWDGVVPDKDVAMLICRQLGLPVRAASLVSPEAFPSVTFMRLRTKAIGPLTRSMCINAEGVASVLECEGIEVAPERGGSCMQVAALSELPGNYLPTAVECTANYTVRIVDPHTGLTTYANGSRVSQGRLEVLQPTPNNRQPVWGTVCHTSSTPLELAQYACRATGLPYRGAYMRSGRRFFVRQDVLSMPIHWVFLEDCRLQSQGLACGVVAGWGQAQKLLRSGGAAANDDPRRQAIRFALKYCDEDGTVGHQADAYVICEGEWCGGGDGQRGGRRCGATAKLGLPVRAASLVSPEAFPSVTFMRLRTKAIGPLTRSMCINAEGVASVLECEGIEVAPERGGSCMQVAALSELPGNYLPTAVECTDTAPPPPSPPSQLRSPPRPDAPGANYTVRIVDPHTGLTTYANGSRVSQGRLEVLQPTPNNRQPVWGTVCHTSSTPLELAQYACRATGLPYRGAYMRSGRRFFVRQDVLSMPIHWVFLEDCRLQSQGLACGVVAGWGQAQKLLRSGGAAANDDPRRQAIRFALKYCDEDGTVGHQADAYVICEDTYPPPPSPPTPPSPAPPPAPPLMIRNDVRLNVTEYFDGVYGVQFGVRHPVSGTIVWGTYCQPDATSIWSYDFDAIGSTVCSQITAGARPYAAFTYVGAPYSFLPPPNVRRDMPAVLAGLDCGVVAGGVLANISLCAAEASEPLPMPPTSVCMESGWNNWLINCQQTRSFNIPLLVSVRLAGGANSSYGRLEVVARNALGRGWGTVCALDFGVEHAQAVCRDLGLPWTQAALLPAAAVSPAPPSQYVAIDAVSCVDDSYYAPLPLSFERDCHRSFVGGSQLKTCGHGADVGVACGVYGPYGGYGGPAPPAYGTYAQP
ncbi:Deleted in malignant brain tumors 1 protein [Tetrabaena socialis]|uniref:Deleted in malignant brain tumors 1 protein n=1 Tax=Tetrabaena socialis TaxID=47790 RepID=A0A2J7ZZE4_9CHLO|nr:Deleted in malignant brain tumors 1 protein [Tetrabaena socialis]|eukprot:PNH05644.1 Deleted in malignant brain tumors 1 protein [Tetrabaena socialis]